LINEELNSKMKICERFLILSYKKKYSGKIVVLNKEEREVVAVGRRFPEIFEKLKLRNLTPEAGTINVY